MESPTAPAAPAPLAETPTISAEVAAAGADDFAAFDEAHLQAKRGTPAPRVEPKADATTPAPPERTLSKRQEDINTKIREAVERATADTQAELTRLRAQIAPPKVAEPAAPVQPSVPKPPEYKRYLAMPDAPKLAEFESVEEHTAAMSLFIADQRDADRQRDAHAKQSDESRAKTLNEQAQAYGERLVKAKEADPDIASKIAPAILQARPISALSPAELKTATFANAVAEAGLHSEDPAALYLHLSQHEADTLTIADLAPSEWLRALARLDGRLSAGPVTATATTSPAAPAARPSTITAAPPPPPQVTARSTSDPKAAALARNDFAAFDRIEMAEAQAKRRGAA